MTDTQVPAGAPATPGSPMLLRELAFGAACAAAVRAACRLKVADALGDAPATPADLAAAVGAQPGPLGRVLRALSAYGVFEELPDGRFQHTGTSRMLRVDAPDTLHYVALWCTEPWTWQAWPRLDEAVRTGRNLFPEMFGKEFFDYLHTEADESARVFDRAMTHSSRQSAQDVAATLDLTGVRDVVDIGGGQGHVLAALLERHPQLEGTLLDLPGVVAGADPRLRDGGPLAARADLVAGDAREDVPVSVDLYVIKNILEWDDTSTRRTLRNVMTAAAPGSRVAVIENLVDDTPSPRFTGAMDLMLLMNVGGRKHTEESLASLMREAGLRVEPARPVNAYLHVIMGTVPDRPRD